LSSPAYGRLKIGPIDVSSHNLQGIDSNLSLSIWSPNVKMRERMVVRIKADSDFAECNEPRHGAIDAQSSI
jgi:hypothetical protein